MGEANEGTRLARVLRVLQARRLGQGAGTGYSADGGARESFDPGKETEAGGVEPSLWRSPRGAGTVATSLQGGGNHVASASGRRRAELPGTDPPHRPQGRVPR